MIITSVVPPELPMELSLAVNTSLVALSKFAIYCTEPFRIPFAGKVDVCCFDKTGTLTGEDLVVEGVCGLGAEPTALHSPRQVSPETTMVLATAQALVQLDRGVIGDPMEKVTLEAIGWTLENDVVLHKESGRRIRILRRFQFTSALKRMSTVSSVASRKNMLLVSVKGAPETLHAMYRQVPSFYEQAYKHFTRRGSRVLALGYKWIPATEDVSQLHRDDMESELEFAGFLVFHCPLKEDSKAAVDMLNKSAHRVIMITGDNPLTACHVARELDIVERDVLILDTDEEDETGETLAWRTVDDAKRIMVSSRHLDKLDTSSIQGYDLCLTGAALRIIQGQPIMNDLLSRVWVYARVSPSQKVGESVCI
jgi:cation-transporting ATPase 13A1